MTVFKSEAEVAAALAKRFDPPAWAMFRNVANGTGAASRRRIDVLAMSVWPSRGLEVHGVEIKVSRRDMLRELKNPEKAEEIARYCDRWWIAVGDARIVDPAELPQTWGLLVPRGSGLVASKEAPQLTPAPLDRAFVASVLRSAHVADADLRREIRNGIYAEVAAAAAESTRDRLERAERERAEAVERYEQLARELQDAHAIGVTTDRLRQALRLHARLTAWDGALGRALSVRREAMGAANDLAKVAESLADLVSFLETAAKESTADGIRADEPA